MSDLPPDVSAEEYAAIVGEDQTAFTEEVFTQVSPADTYQPNWHVDCIIEHLQAVEDGQIRRLLVTVPPRSMKSITISVAWPAWLLGRDPRRRIVGASYGDALAKKHSLDCRLVVESPIYQLAFPNTKLATDQNEKGMFMTTYRGFRKATSVGGQITGEGGDFLIFDDLLKPNEAPSDTIRNGTNDWLDQTFLGRINDLNTGRIVGVAQRLHMDDPMGHCIDKGGWHLLNLPAEFKKKTFITLGKHTWVKEAGDLLDPIRLSPTVLAEKLNDLGAYAYAGQYQQAPVPEGGGDFKARWIQYYNPQSSTFSARGMNVYILYDPANSKKKRSNHDPDFTAMVVVGLAPDNNYYLLDMIRDRLNPTERVETLIKLHKDWNKKSGKPPKVGCEQYGMMTDAFYIKQAQTRLNYRFPLIELGGRLSKPERIKQLVTPFEEGRIYLPKVLPYVTTSNEKVDLVASFVDEYDTFPVGRHDDMMDAFARIFEEKMYATFPKPQASNFVRGGDNLTGSASSDFQSFTSPTGRFDPNDLRTW